MKHLSEIYKKINFFKKAFYFFNTENFLLTTEKLGKKAFGDVYFVKNKIDNIEYSAKVIDTQKSLLDLAK